MSLADPQFARSDVLRVFNHAELYLLLGRVGRVLPVVVSPIVLCLAILTAVVGSRDVFRFINNGVVVAALVVVIATLIRIRTGSPDVTLIRRSLFWFIAGAIYDNVTGVFGHYDNVEPSALSSSSRR